MIRPKIFASVVRTVLVLCIIVTLIYRWSGLSSSQRDELPSVGGKTAAPPIRPGRPLGKVDGPKPIAKPGAVVQTDGDEDRDEEVKESYFPPKKSSQYSSAAELSPPIPIVDEDHDDAARPAAKTPVGVAKLLQQQPVSYTEYMKLDPDHYPPWDEYMNADYDPNRWHYFDIDEALFTTKVSGQEENSSRANVDLDVDPSDGKPCLGPRGQPMGEDQEGKVYGYELDSNSFPSPFFGSYEAIGLNGSVCYDRFSRLRAYGLGDSADPASELESLDVPDALEWEKVQWGDLQKRCVADNVGRFKVRPNAGIDSKTFFNDEVMKNGVRKEHGKISRTAVVLRTWAGYKYEWNDIHSIRSLVAELALTGRGEYEVFILLHVKDNDIDIRGNKEAAHKIVEANIPPEFRDMVILFNEHDLKTLYPLIGSNDVYQHQYQPLQYFAIHHPEYDYVWNWEMDARYLGHHLPFLRAITSFANAQPRLYLWERSSRFFLPAVHKTWELFTTLVNKVVPIQLTTWGPFPSVHKPFTPILAPGPIVDPENKKWGIDEPADFITLLPLFDPQNTMWAPRDRTFNFDQHLTTPRRAFINTLTRLSTRLLHAMHLENKAGRAMVTEMWPSTVALHYGLKVVYAPHPIFATRKWNPAYADEIFNPGPEVAPGTGPESVYAVDREHNFGGMSWYYDGGAAGTIYRRWLGWDVNGPEGKVTVGTVKEQWDKVRGKEGDEDRLCLPPMLLHPVKDVAFDKRAAWNGKENPKREKATS